MRKSNAIFTMIILFAVIFTLLFPNNSPMFSTNFDDAVIALYSGKVNEPYEKLRSRVDAPTELPTEYSFTESESERDFEVLMSASVGSGYYRKPFTLYVNCEYDLYYTTDGTLPTKDSIKYDRKMGIYVDDTVSFCFSAEHNGYYSCVYYGSYVILKDATDYKYAYGYNSLKPSERMLYEQFYNAAKNYETTIDIGKRGFDLLSVQKIYTCLNYDNPTMMQVSESLVNWRGSKNNVSAVRAEYEYDRNLLNFEKKRLEEKAEQILSRADGALSLMEYLHRIHYEIISNADYLESDGQKTYEATGVLCYGNGVCESYSRAFQYLCQKIGVDCILVVGMNEDIGHMWNMVKLDGEWYHIDLTWDDGGDYIVYDFFNVDDATITEMGERTISPFIEENRNILDCNVFPIPKAVSNKYNFFNYFEVDRDNAYTLNGEYD